MFFSTPNWPDIGKRIDGKLPLAMSISRTDNQILRAHSGSASKEIRQILNNERDPQMARLTVQSRIGTIVLTAAVLLSGCAGGRDNTGFEARVYEVQLKSDQSGKLDVAAINARMARGEDLGRILAESGVSKLIYRICQPMGYNCDSNIALSTRIPMITNTRTSASGRKLNTVRYQLVGPDFKIYTLPTPDRSYGRVQVRLNADMAIPGLGAPTTRKISLNCSNIVKVGEPFVAGAMASNTGEANGSSMAYVCCVSVAPSGMPGDVSTSAAPTTRPASAPSTADFQAAI